jgi:hypothetical protein
MRALCEGMNTGVCSSGAVNAYSFASDALKGALEVILHRVTMRLALPASDRRTVISDDKFQSAAHTNLVFGDGSEVLVKALSCPPRRIRPVAN